MLDCWHGRDLSRLLSRVSLCAQVEQDVGQLVTSFGKGFTVLEQELEKDLTGEERVGQGSGLLCSASRRRVTRARRAAPCAYCLEERQQPLRHSGRLAPG